MSFDFKRRGHSFSPYSLYDISRKYKENILDDYQYAWDVNNESAIRSCEQQLIKLDKKTLEEKIKVVQVKLNKMLQYCTEEERFDIFERYLSQRLKVKSSLTEIDLLTDQIDPHNEFLLKLCYWDIFCAKRNNECCKEFLRQNIDYLVTNTEICIPHFQVKNLQKEKIKTISCTMLLCHLNWNICKTQTRVILQNDTEPPASSSDASVADTSVSYSCTAHKVSNILQIVWSTLSKDDISTVFNNYINKMSAMKTDLTEDDFCTDKIEPYFEFISKLCYWDYLCIKKDYKRCKEFLRRNADLFVPQIEEVVHGNKTKTKHISCKVLLCLLNLNICDQKSTLTQSKHVRSVLQNLLSTLTDDDIMKVFNNYIDQMYAIKSEITPDGLCIGETGSNHEYQLKLCYWTTICRTNDNKAFKKFIQLYPEFLVSNIKKRSVLTLRTKTKRFFCKTLLCILNWNICALKTAPHLVQKTEIQASSSVVIIDDSSPKYSCTAETVNSILQTLLSTLSEGEIFTTFNNYIDILYAMKSEITEDDFCTGKIEPYLEFQLKLCYCTGKWSKPQVEFITKNTKFFLSMVEEVNKRNQLRMKFKMCQVLNIIMDAKICIRESMIHSVTNICEDDAVEALIMMERNLLPGTNNDKNTENPNQMVACILLLKTKLDNLSEHTVNMKMLIQYKDHIKELLLSLLAIVLTKFSTSQINEAFYLYNNTTCVSNPTIQLELAKTFLDIRLNPKITQHRKSIIEDKIKQLLISHDTSKTVLPPFTEFTDSTSEKLDHKRIINICINIVKTESKDINIPMYEGFFCTERKAIENEVEMKKRSQETETLVLLMLLLMTITSTGHHKSAKLKKYLTLKYEYATASLHLLWCSGDIEVHPGPSLSKKSLTHDSSIERRWIQNISPKILILLPEHEQSKYKPTKKVRNDRENREHFKLLKTCLEEKVHVPKMYLAEINAWETMEYTILHKLFVYRCEIETIIASLQDFLICGGSTTDLTDIKVELETNDITTILGKDHRPTDKSQLMVYITRHIAGISIKCAHEKDPDAKCDGLWDLPLKNWPKQIILFDPNNRGKYSKKYPGQKLISDQELVDMLLRLPQVTIPQKYKDIVEAFRTMRKSQKDKSINKQRKAELCTTFKRITSLEKLDYALKNLWESGIFTEEVHNNLNKWWTTRAVDTTDDQNVSQVNIIKVQKRRRPHILINISTKSITLTVEQTDANSSQVIYDFPFKDECVPLKTSQAILESDIKHQRNISTEETALCSTINFDQPTSSTKQMSQLNQNIATPNQSTTNSDDTTSATKDSQSLHFHTQVSPISIMGSSYSISSVNSKSGNDDGDQNNISNEGQDLLTDSDYSSHSSNNCVSNTNIKKRKFKEEDSNETKKRKIPSQEDKKPIETNHRQMDCLMDNTASFNKNREILPDWLLDSDLDSYDIDNQTFKVDQNALDNEDTELVKFLQDFIDCESEINVTNEII